MSATNKDSAARKRAKISMTADTNTAQPTDVDHVIAQSTGLKPSNIVHPVDVLQPLPPSELRMLTTITAVIPSEIPSNDLSETAVTVNCVLPAPQNATVPTQDLTAGGSAVALNGNRARFMAGLQPSKVTCDLTTTPVSPGLRFSFEAVIVVVYPASTSPPERRYIEVIDQHGTTGITVWNQNAHVVNRDSVGCVVKFTRLALTMHNGKKNLTMSKESTMHIEMPTADGMLMKWWRSLLSEPTLTCIQFHDTPALQIVNISGILGCIHTEEKNVKGEPKILLVLLLTDRTGKIEIRSWNHSDTEFKRFQEKPVLLKRVRVCLYAGTRTGELLTGSNGTTITTDFDHSDLDKYWAE
jgi:hypothetical protein